MIVWEQVGESDNTKHYSKYISMGKMLVIIFQDENKVLGIRN